MNTPLERRDGARPAVSPNAELRPGESAPERGALAASDDSLGWVRHTGPTVSGSTVPGLDQAIALILLIALVLVAAWSALPQLSADQAPDQSLADPTPDEPAAVDLTAHQKRLASKAAYRARKAADPEFRQSESQRVREWRQNYPEKTRAQKRKARSANYHRPFVAIDSEGQNYPGDDILYCGVRYPKHVTYLWGASADDGRPPLWLAAAESRGLDKRPLDVVQILDWLVSLPDQFGPAVYVSFSFGYDVTQILKHLPYEKAWEIEKRETYSDKRENRRPIANAPVFWRNYAISYVKGKSFDVWRLADTDRPYINGKINKDAHIRIYDAFGFFQSSFTAVVDSMVKSGRASKPEADFLSSMKDKRDEFSTVPIEEIQKYTTLELRLLARMMADLREGFDQSELRCAIGMGRERRLLRSSKARGSRSIMAATLPRRISRRSKRPHTTHIMAAELNC